MQANVQHSSVMMVSLASCPTELLQLFFKSLSSAELRAVCLVSRGLRNLVEPLLYSTIHWEWLEDLRPPPVGLLLRSILERPELATHIRSLSLTGHTFYLPHFRGTVPKIPRPGHELDTYIDSVRNSGVPYGDLWVYHLVLGTMDAFVALLVSLLSNLTTLQLGPNFAKETQLLGMVLRSALHEKRCSGQAFFPYLREVSLKMGVDTYRDHSYKNTKDVLPFLYLPDVRHLSLSIENPSLFVWPIGAPPSPSSLTSLDLTLVRETHLGTLLSVTKGLEILRWDWYHNPALQDPYNRPNIDLAQIAAALSNVRGSLKELTISADCDLGWAASQLPQLTISGSLDDLSGFRSLKKLSIPLPFLLGFSPDTSNRLKAIVPRHLEHLTITDDLRLHEEYLWDDHALLETLQNWLEGEETSDSSLRSICLLLRETDDEWGPTKRAELQDLCARVGTEVEIVKLLEDL